MGDVWCSIVKALGSLLNSYKYQQTSQDVTRFHIAKRACVCGGGLFTSLLMIFNIQHSWLEIPIE